MKKAKLLLLTLLAVIGYGTAGAETVSPYTVDFNTAITTSKHDFQVASNWGHIVGQGDYDGWGPYFMSYSYNAENGIDGSGTLMANRQYAGDNGGGEVINDLLVTPAVSGAVKLYVKASSLASSSQPSFVEFYTLNEAGTAKADLLQRFTADKYVVDEAIEGWSYVTINVSTAQKIGIRAQHVYLDNFSAESADIQKERKLAIASAEPSATTGTIYWNQQENGKVLVKYTVTVTNTGDLALAKGDENYSISIVNRRANEVCATVAVPQTLEPGATSEKFDVSVELDPSVWPNSYTYISMDLKENISGSVLQRAQSHYKAYEPKFVFREGGSTSTSSLYGDIAFGKVTEELSKAYEIYNDGTAPLQVKSITVPTGFTVSNAGNFTLASKENKSFDITLPVTTQGIFSGDVEVVYVDKNGDDVTYKKAITGTVLDPSKNIITFDDGNGSAAYPTGSVRYNVYISSEGSGDSKNYYLQGTNGNPLFITPLMTAAAGEKIAFDAEYTSSSDAKVEVMISTDRQNWTTIETVSNIASQYNWTTYTAEIPEAGDYYIGFKLTNSKIDDVYGLVYAEAAAHNLLIVKSDIPAKGIQNNTYTATVSVGNIGPNVEAAGSYTATLYVDGEAVATNNKVDLPVANINGNYNNLEEQNYTTLSFSFKPHTIGTLPAYIEVKSGDNVVKTEEVTVNIAKEELSSDIAVGENKTTGRYAPFYGYDMEQGAYADFYYSAEQLATFGIKKGDVIKSIKFKSSNSSKTINSLTAEAWVGMEENGSFAAGQVDKDNMTHVVLYDQETVDFDKEVEMVIDLSENPIVYDGTSEIRVYTYINGGGAYLSFGWEVDSNYPQQAYYTKNETSWDTNKSQACPVGYFGLDVKPVNLSGIIYDVDTREPIEGATVTLYNEAEDVEYTAVSDAQGKYVVDVIQNTLDYRATITAEGYEDLKVFSETYNVSEGSDESDFGLMSKYVNVTITEAGFATLYYGNRSLKVPEGVTAYTVKVEGTEALKSVEYDVLPQGSAVILEGAPGDYVFEVNWDADQPDTENLLLGTDEKQTTAAADGSQTGYKFYKLANGKSHGLGFYFATENGAAFENEAHKAYLAVKADAAANFYTFNPTGISVVSTTIPENGEVYNLSGVRMNSKQLPAGIYIVNGKKVVIK